MAKQKTEAAAAESPQGQKPERKHSKATILSSSRWKAGERQLLAIALEDGRKYTLGEAKAALDTLKRKKVH